MIKTAIFLAEGFEEVEALTVVDLLRRAGIGCDMVSAADKALVTGSHGITVKADLPFCDLRIGDYEGVILPGGQPGTANLADDARILSLLYRFHTAGKLTAAICAAPTVLAKAGLLTGKKAICYPGLENRLTDAGAEICKEAVAADGHVITSRGVGTAIPFALAIIEYFQSRDAANKVAKRIVYPTKRQKRREDHESTSDQRQSPSEG